MERIIVLCALLILSCSKKIVNTNIPISKEFLNLELKLYVNQDYILDLIIVNNSDNNIHLSDPSCYVNSKISVMNKNGKLTPQLRIKLSFSCNKTMISFMPGQKETFPFPYKLTDLFSLQKDKKYQIYLQYVGGIFDADDKLIEGNLRAELSFIHR